MMSIHTIEGRYEYRLQTILKNMLKDWEQDFDNEDDMFDWLLTNSSEFGKLVINDMIEWNDEWLEGIE